MLNRKGDINKALEHFISKVSFELNPEKTFADITIVIRGTEEKTLPETLNVKKIDYEMIHNLIDDYGCSFMWDMENKDFVFVSESASAKSFVYSNGKEDYEFTFKATLQLIPLDELTT